MCNGLAHDSSRALVLGPRIRLFVAAIGVRSTLNCEAKYLTEEDPWGIGDADSARYDLYVDWIRGHPRARGSVLDIGCGFGAMLARLQPDFERCAASS